MFFCGAGVSRAKVGLSDFFGLAWKVVKALGVSEADPAWKLLSEAQELQKRTGYTISADRVFGLLERDFPVHDIEHQIASSLRPPADPDLTAHHTMIELATTQEGRVHLITSNFDRLFEDCRPGLRVWHPSHLPNLTRGEALDGIVHLHGIADVEYSGADQDPFVLSSSQFGRAYLSDGWATQFIRTVLDRYVVVFVGYAADDPPVQYLLEALNIGEALNQDVFAFQSNTDADAKHRWRQKGATPIVYDGSTDYSPLWDTLAAWSVRAQSPDAWSDAVLSRADQGPSTLSPHERGQVAHLASTVVGARKIALADQPLPAEWLCVFDPYVRYGETSDLEGQKFDPFVAYGLDFDEPPPKSSRYGQDDRRETPTSAWDAFASTPGDAQSIDPRRLSVLRGHLTLQSIEMPSRLGHLGTWISRVAGQPACIWWAVRQGGLHPNIRSRISHSLSHELKDAPPAVRECWHYLLEAYETNKTDFGSDWFSLKSRIKRIGWSSAVVREVVEIAKPYFKVERAWIAGHNKPPSTDDDVTKSGLARIDVEYPSRTDEITVPNEWLIPAIRGFRHNLMLAVQMETEHHVYDVRRMASIIKDNTSHDEDGRRERHDRTNGLLGYVLYFVDMFERLIAHDIEAAKAEYRAWPADDDYTFARLRIWASGKPELLDNDEAASVFHNLTDEAFWDAYHQRDLLLSLKVRWSEIDKDTRDALEQRLVRGRDRWANEDDDEDFHRDRAIRSLGRLYWLRNQGCAFSFDLDKETAPLRAAAGDWNPRDAKGADTEQGGVTVRFRSTDEAHDVLKDVALADVLSVSAEHAGQTSRLFVERDPFAGLVKSEPVRAYSALAIHAKRGEHPAWAWRTFLNDDKRKTDKPRFVNLIAQRMIRCPSAELAQFPYAIFDWFYRIGELLSRDYPNTYDHLFSHLASAIDEQNEHFSSSLMGRSSDVDWVAEAINAPGGKLAEALMEDSRREPSEDGGGFPMDWLEKWNRLFRLPQNDRCYAVTIAAFNLRWFFGHGQTWTKANLLQHLGSDSVENEALLCGFLWNGSPPFGQLYEILKDTIAAKAASRAYERRGYRENLAALVMVGWGIAKTTNDKPIFDHAEFRSILLEADDDFRSTVLWLFERWSSDTEKEDNPWPDLLIPFLESVWPRHKKAKTPRATMRLCNIAFGSGDRFLELVEIILPLVSVINDDRTFLYELRDEENEIVRTHPRRALDLIFAVVPEDAELWPYGLDETLDALCEADDGLWTDPKMIELRRRWNSR